MQVFSRVISYFRQHFTKYFDSIFKRYCWSFKVFLLRPPDSFSVSDLSSYKIVETYYFGQKKIRWFRGYKEDIADPFPIFFGGSLFIFHETKVNFSKGVIDVIEIRENKVISHDTVIDETFHLSFPNVFEYHGKLLMTPESLEASATYLYESCGLATVWRRKRKLLDRGLADPNLFFSSDIKKWVLHGTTVSNESVYYVAENLDSCFYELEKFKANAKTARSAGRVIKCKKYSIRPFQDCSISYGESIGFMRVQVTQDGISEDVLRERFPKDRFQWNRNGSHTFNLAACDHEIVFVVDGKRRTHWADPVFVCCAFVVDVLSRRLARIHKERADG